MTLIDVEAFVDTMARVPSAVCVVTTFDGARSWGFTASSFVSVSLDPPLILVCLGKAATTHPAFAVARHFMVNVLAAHQARVARCFATPDIDRFAAGYTEPCELGLPGISEASVRVACSMWRLTDAGDHSILIGQVEAAQASSRPPLLYCNRTFEGLSGSGDAGQVLGGRAQGRRAPSAQSH